MLKLPKELKEYPELAYSIIFINLQVQIFPE
ncbi:hypothetical protein FHS59_004331 [Algoriphagus iocasae]|uniref:Uncharacterized protein n=1 Tax=Algoriphagus iocasae TaxID=1836499 RepID=A0A841N1Y7_9BACT|nr:hypothetical protein [Algoriphagus iocasae]